MKKRYSVKIIYISQSLIHGPTCSAVPIGQSNVELHVYVCYLRENVVYTKSKFCETQMPLLDTKSKNLVVTIFFSVVTLYMRFSTCSSVMVSYSNTLLARLRQATCVFLERSTLKLISN